MKIEIRSDSVTVSGYANVPGRLSRPVNTPRGRVLETIAQGAFEKAIKKAGNIVLKLDHRREIAETRSGSLTAKEDEIGLFVSAIIVDPETVAGAKSGKLRGWSFGMRNVKDNIENRADELPIRTVEEFDLTEITLSLNSRPFYSATSLEVRADESGLDEIEYRAFEDNEVKMLDKTSLQEKKEILKKMKEKKYES